MVYLKNKFQLGKFPYVYKCPKCNDKHYYDKEKYELMLSHIGQIFDNPVFFECYFHRGQLMKPIGYTGEPGYVMWLPK